MKSTVIIHEIIARFGDEDKRKLMELLKDLRVQIASETRLVINKQTNIGRQAARKKFNELINFYQNGT